MRNNWSVSLSLLGRSHAHPSPSATTPAVDPSIRYKWLALVFVVTAQLMVVLDSTIVNIAMLAAQADLGFSDHDRQWLVTAYALAFGSLLLISGRIADFFGQKRAFLIGLAGFGLASMLGGFAPSLAALIAARAGQGVFGALLASAALSLISTMFVDTKERATAFGVYGLSTRRFCWIPLIWAGAAAAGEKHAPEITQRAEEGMRSSTIQSCPGRQDTESRLVRVSE